MADNSSWWRRLIATINREYERRIRAASLVTEYGAGHGHHGSHGSHDDDDEGAEILNVPRGTRLHRAEHPSPPAEHSSAE